MAGARRATGTPSTVRASVVRSSPSRPRSPHYRKRIYDSIGRLVDTPAGALAFMDCYIDRTEGRPTKKIETTVRPPATFVLTQRDGTVVPALPEKVGGGATPAAASAEDAMILGLQPVRL